MHVCHVDRSVCPYGGACRLPLRVVVSRRCVHCGSVLEAKRYVKYYWVCCSNDDCNSPACISLSELSKRRYGWSTFRYGKRS